MKMKFASKIALALLLIGMVTLTFNIQPVKAPNGIDKIYIRADGSIDPSDAPISTDDNVTYFLLENINKSIIIERENITFNGRGLTVSGPEETNSIGINVTGGYNVTIKNTNIEKFDMGIYAVYSSHITLTGNNASNNKFYFLGPGPDFEIIWTGTGISISRSNETLIFNNTVSNNIFGISLYQSNNTRVVNNNASYNNQHEDSTYYGTGIYISDSKNITVADNVVSNNGAMGICVGSAVNSTIHNNTITGHAFGSYSYGLYVSDSRNNTIAENSIFSNLYGIYVRYYSRNQTIINNNVSLNTWGVYLDDSPNNTIIGNTLFKNVDGITFENNASYNKILYNTISNTTSFGIYIRTGSRNNLVLGNNVSNGTRGVRFTESSNNSIFGNIISSSTSEGLIIYYYSSNNEVINNNITSNPKGLIITFGSYNTKVFHNNFIGNTEHVYTDMNSTWDNDYPSGGNYWSNYTDVDFKSGIFQNDTGSDGIGDAEHVINANNTDRFPLMAPLSTFNAGIWNEISCYVDVISNSTISNFKINATEKMISFNVTGETGVGFCRIIIPNVIIQTLWLNNYNVLVNGLPVEFRNWTDTENTYVYFTYSHSEHEVTIIPELTFASLLPLLMLVTMLVINLKKKKHH
jgi:parallel beta-helix repeat protein